MIYQLQYLNNSVLKTVNYDKKKNIKTFSMFNHYKKNHYNSLKKDIKSIKLITQRDYFFNYFYLISSTILFIVFFNTNFIGAIFLITSNILFLTFYKKIKYKLLIYYKESGFVKITILKKEIEEVEELIERFN
jgi:hypothetical protein